jgi:hypothetical protein
MAIDTQAIAEAIQQANSIAGYSTPAPNDRNAQQIKGLATSVLALARNQQEIAREISTLSTKIDQLAIAINSFKRR